MLLDHVFLALWFRLRVLGFLRDGDPKQEASDHHGHDDRLHSLDAKLCNNHDIVNAASRIMARRDPLTFSDKAPVMKGKSAAPAEPVLYITREECCNWFRQCVRQVG